MMKATQTLDLPLDALRQYTRWVRQDSPTASQNEAFSLKLLVKDPQNEKARTSLMTAYQPMILSLAQKYAGRCEALELLDLVQEGNIGLLIALNKIQQFDATQGTDFRTWAYAWIRGQMLYAIWSTDRGVIIPRPVLRSLGHYQLVIDYLSAQGQGTPSLERIAHEMGIAKADVAHLREIAEQREVSLDDLAQGPKGATLADILAAPTDNPQSNYRQWFLDALNQLPDHEREVLQLRYGLDNGLALSYVQIAKALSLSVERVTTLDQRAKQHLRRLYLTAQRQQAAS